jgi:hypothetical protein
MEIVAPPIDGRKATARVVELKAAKSKALEKQTLKETGLG